MTSKTAKKPLPPIGQQKASVGVVIPEDPKFIIPVTTDFDPQELTGDEKEYSLQEVAEMLGLHRVTLIRMEQRKAIPKPRWRRRPQPHRVFNKDEIEVIRKILNPVADAKGRKFVE